MSAASLLLPPSFKGVAYQLASNWVSYVPIHEFQQRPITYLEIGTFYGANVLSVVGIYGQHPDSKMYCIDPWMDYPDYPEYKDQQSSIYETFLSNVESTPGAKEKIVVHRGFSHEVVPSFPDDMFDLIYIDGNHEPEYVLEDAVLSFRKLKRGGIMIFDDYGWGGPDLTQRGIDAFISGYHKRIQVLGMCSSQVFVMKEK